MRRGHEQEVTAMESNYRVQLATLARMGFSDIDTNVAALARADGVVTRAIDLIVSGEVSTAKLQAQKSEERRRKSLRFAELPETMAAKVRELVGMGFADEGKCRHALSRSKWDVQDACSLLVESGDTLDSKFSAITSDLDVDDRIAVSAASVARRASTAGLEGKKHAKTDSLIDLDAELDPLSGRQSVLQQDSGNQQQQLQMQMQMQAGQQEMAAINETISSQNFKQQQLQQQLQMLYAQQNQQSMGQMNPFGQQQQHMQQMQQPQPQQQMQMFGGMLPQQQQQQFQSQQLLEQQQQQALMIQQQLRQQEMEMEQLKLQQQQQQFQQQQQQSFLQQPGYPGTISQQNSGQQLFQFNQQQLNQQQQQQQQQMLGQVQVQTPFGPTQAFNNQGNGGSYGGGSLI